VSEVVSRAGWETKRLDEVVDILDSRRVPVNSKERESRRGPVPYYGATGQVGWIDDHIFDEEIILLGEDGAPFLDTSKEKAYLVRGKSWVNNHAHVLRAKPGVPALYLKYWLDRLDYRPFVNGTTRLKLTQAEMRRIPVPLAPEQERYEIVAELEKQFSRLDEAVANLQRVKANLKRYKASVLKAAVEGRLVETEATLARREGRTYETGEQLLQRILEVRRAKWAGKGKYQEPEASRVSDLGELPDGWTWASAVQACEQVVDCHNKTAPYTSTGIPLVRTTNIKDGRLLLDDTRFVDQLTYEFWSRRCPPEPGDVLFTREAPMGEAGIIPPGVKLCLGQRTMLMRPAPAISSSFLLSALLSPVVKDLIDRVAVGSGVKHLRVGDVERLPVPLPPVAEQVRIVAEVDRHLSIIREVESEVDANLKRAQALRQSTLTHVFSPPCLKT
jgi:type I restriction enzyme S subunit